MRTQQKYFSQIAAYVYISESELAKVMDYNASITEEELKPILHSLGLNTEQQYLRQDGLQHRNRFNEIVVCSRWVGNERYDDEWIMSGYASKEAVDRHKNNRLLDESYRAKGLTHDIQAVLESREVGNKGVK